MRNTTRVIFALLLTSLLLASPAAPRFDRWRILGPGGGGAQFLPTISPHDPRHVLVGCDMTGSYLSKDGGATWRMFNLRGRAQFFVFDPNDASTIYAQSIGLWRSTDFGKSWHLIHPDPASIQRINMQNDHAGEQIVTSGEPAGSIQSLAVDPADSNVLFAVLQKRGGVTLVESSDRGRTWRKTADLEARGTIYVDPRSPRRDRTLYIIGAHCAAREAGVWREILPRQGSLTGWSAGFPEGGGKPIIYGRTGSKATLSVSTDGGVNWNDAAFPGEWASFQAAATSLVHPNVAYVSYKGLRLDGASWFGVAKTVDAGKTWELVWKESREPAPNLHDVWVTERFGPGWGENPLALGVSPTDPNICYGTDYGRTMRTEDGGKTWNATYSTRQNDGSYTTTGLDVTTCYGVHFDPFDSKRIFISYTDIGLFRSENGGSSWISSTTGVPQPWVNTTYWIVFDPKVRGRVWGVMSGVHDLPRPKMWGARSPSTFNGGVCVSDDGARTWRRSTEGMPESAVTHILLDPDSAPDARTLYVTAFGRGVFKSTDGGGSWVLKNAGIEGAEPFAWRLAQDHRKALYLVVARRRDNSGIGDAEDGALYRTEDGAESWSRIALPPGVNGPNGIAIDPENSNRLYLAAWGRTANPYLKRPPGTPWNEYGGGIFLSEDRGATWRNVLPDDQHVYDVTIDDRDPKVLYGCGFESSAWRSADRGATWKRIKGYNFKWGHRVVPDPRDRQLVYITTFGGSVWHGPALGDPNAPEDIATSALAH